MDKEQAKLDGGVCNLPDIDLTRLKVVELRPEPAPGDYSEAMEMAKEEALKHMEDYMLMSWYDRDRDFESPQHATESDADSALPGYVYYGVNHGATLKVDIDGGRFVFFFAPVEW